MQKSIKIKMYLNAIVVYFRDRKVLHLKFFVNMSLIILVFSLFSLLFFRSAVEGNLRELSLELLSNSIL